MPTIDLDAIAQLNMRLGGRYTLERTLGSGGMATVYLAEDLKHHRKVALKVLKPELAAVLGAERFVQEITTTARLQHPHILPLFDSGTADGFLFYAMPWIQGETLRDKLSRETQLGVDDAVRIAREVADALDYAHQHGIVHRDIKPENILLHGGHAIVADFGIALAVSAAAGGRMTETGLSLGTPHYMSPEQATAEKEITARSDVYSLGSVLYEMLTGNPPHTGASAQQIIMKIITEPAVSVTTFRKSVPSNVAAAVAKAIEKLPADRFESAKAFGDALANPAYTNAAYTNAAFSAATPAPALVRRRRVREAILAGALVVACAVAIMGWLRSAMLLRRAEAVVVHVAFSVAPSQGVGLVLGRTLALSPDDRTVVYATADSAGRLRLFSRALDDLRRQPIAGTEGASQPFYSPDGRWIGFVDGRQLKKIAVDGGSPTPLADLAGLTGASWGPDGIILSDNGALKLVPSSGGTPVSLMRGDSTRGYWPVLLPGNQAVAYATASNGVNAPIAAAFLRTGRSVNLGVDGTFPLGVVNGELIVGQANGTLLAVPFDIGALRVTGSGHVVLADVLQNPQGEPKAALSPGGSLAYVSDAGTMQAVEVDAHGVARPLAVPPGKLNNPRYSPDGRRVLADLVSGGGSRDIWIFDVASGARQRLTSSGANQRAEWTPDGKRVLFRSNSTQHGTIWWQPADGSGAAQELVASLAGKDVWEAVMSPNADAVVYRTGTIGTGDIWYRRLAGDTAETGFANTRFTEFAPRFSPDGRWIAYVSDESGDFQVYVRPFPGPGAQVPVSIGGGNTPVWSRDGRTIFFSNGIQFIAASVATSPTFSVSARTVLFEGNYQLLPGHASFDVSPDGKSFLMLRPLSGSSEEVVVIHNWKAELRDHAKDVSAR
jgi:serine/threonine-protein kinase